MKHHYGSPLVIPAQPIQGEWRLKYKYKVIPESHPLHFTSNIPSALYTFRFVDFLQTFECFVVAQES